MREILKNKNLSVGILILILGSIFIAYGPLNKGVITESKSVDQVQTLQKESLETSPTVTVGKTIIPVEIRRTPEELQKGLSGRASLDAKSGMIFIFDKSAKYRFWMPDMHFSIDIIWIDENKKIVGIHENVSTEFDPEDPKFYIAPKPAKYVLEVNAGFSKKNGIGVGNEIIFDHVEK